MNAHPPAGLHHVEIYVSNPETSRAFWRWFLEEVGYEPFQSWEQGFSYVLGSAYLVFVQTEEKYLDQTYHRCRTGLNHLAFWARDRAHVDTLTQTLLQKGVKVLYADKHPYAGGPDYYAVFFEDPDRIKVELVAPEMASEETRHEQS